MQKTQNLLLGIVAIMLAGGARAVPCLQLDILGGTYDVSTETTVASADSFVLRALLRVTSSTPLSDTYYVSAAIEPMLGNVGSLPDIGSVVIDGTIYSSTLNASAWQWGSPPIDAIDNSSGTGSNNLPSHGAFPTYYLEFAFNFDSSHLVSSYNTATGASASGQLYYHDFTIDVSQLADPRIVHFDLYSEEVRNGDYSVDKFAPFSHDAESGALQVPEGGLTAIMLGLGMIALFLAGQLSVGSTVEIGTSSKPASSCL